MRVWYNGITSDFQSEDVGSIPIIRSTCPNGGTVDTAVLEAVAEMHESSNLSSGTKY